MYRRRRTLTDGVLLALSDPACTALDLWGCGTMLSDKALRRAICGMPYLKVAAVEVALIIGDAQLGDAMLTRKQHGTFVRRCYLFSRRHLISPVVSISRGTL